MFVLFVSLGAIYLAPSQAQLAIAQSNTITVQVDRPGAAIAPTMFGLFFEDINFGADGGLYPERVKNRSVDVDLVSLYPKETWKNRQNGLRSDLAQLLAEMKPGFLRFPGGCIVEGRHLETRYQWKTTGSLHFDAWQWTPNLIWFDNLRSYGTPSYYVQKLFGANRGSRVLPVQLNGSAKNGQQNLFASASLDDKAGEVVLKLVNTEASPKEVRINLAGATKIGSSGKAFILASADLKAENSLDEPRKIAPVERRFAAPSGDFNFILEPNSLTVALIPAR